MSSTVNEKQVLGTLAQAGIKDGISGVRITDGRVTFVMEVESARGPEIETLRQKAEAAVMSLDGVTQVSAIMTAKRGEASDGSSGGYSKSKPARIENLAPSVDKIIAVASGKGGVGKSTVAVNLVAALAAQGYKTGLMDADIYGPSAPMMLGVDGRPQLKDEKLQPHVAHGIEVMSMGFLVEDDAPMIWRGPMIQTALRQFLQDVNWGALDYLIVDMPPGTGDAQLTMAQKVPLAGAVIVSTPQDIALLDARKGLNMFRQVGTPVLGIIENMSHYHCPECGHEAHIFGRGGAEKEAKKMDVPLLGRVPLHMDVRIAGDAGKPVVLSQPESAYGRAFEDITNAMLEQLSDASKRAQAS